jgi:hypothetical protein
MDFPTLPSVFRKWETWSITSWEDKNAKSVGEEDAYEDIRTSDAATSNKLAMHARGASLLVFLISITQVVKLRGKKGQRMYHI